MKKLGVFITSLLLSMSLMAGELSNDQLTGVWLIKSLNGQSDGVYDLWEFDGKKFTQNLEGHRMRPDAYSVDGNNIDIGYAKIKVLEFNSKLMKADMAGFTYQLEKQSDTVIKKPKPAKKISPEVKEIAKDFSKLLMDSEPKPSEINCKKAVRNGVVTLETMQSVMEKNYYDGYVEKERFEQVTVELNKFKKGINVKNCANSTGKTQKFYTCLSNNKNHIAQCGKKYNYNG